jgi:mono/diheme cytochrome c family protein
VPKSSAEHHQPFSEKFYWPATCPDGLPSDRRQEIQDAMCYSFLYVPIHHLASLKTILAMKTILSISLLVIAVVCFGILWQTAPATPKAPQTDLVQRGEYLVGIVGCDDCHTPKTMTPQGPVPDMSRRFMGHPADELFVSDDKKNMIATQHVAVFSPGMTAIAGPWGVSYAANITSDATGIGAWSEAQFIKAIREGKLKGLDGTRPLLPPMPWPVYAKMTDEDLKAMYAYLKTVKPIRNVVPMPDMP